MAKIHKHVNRGIPPNARSQSFRNADAVQGDILDINRSLGHPARLVRIEVTVAPIAVRFNVLNTVFAKHGHEGIAGLPGLEGQDNMGSGLEYTDETVATVHVEANTTFELDHDFPVRDIELTTISGNFDIFVL